MDGVADAGQISLGLEGMHCVAVHGFTSGRCVFWINLKQQKSMPNRKS
jgi:hypothetical protein